MMSIILFATALGLSAVAAYYSIMGLVAIFAAAATPIFIMGSLLEVSKLVVASWLYRNWKEVPRLMTVYFTIALVVLMMLTSMGIFGYLSKAHLDQAVPTGESAAKLSLIDEKIKTEKENLNAAREELNQLDQQVNQTLSRTTDARGAERSVAIRRAQQKDRARILAEIGEAQTKIAQLQEERAPVASEVRKVEAEVGPIKYIAQLIYGQEAQDADFLEKAVRIVILMIVAVFDPLAVLLLVAANWNLRNQNNTTWTDFFNKEKAEDFPEPEQIKPDAWIADVGEPPTEQEKKEIIEEQPKVIETEDDLLFEEQVSVQKKDWEPELYKRVNQEPPEKELGRFESELLEQEKKRKIQSFLGKIGEIEQEVDNLNKPNPK